MNESGTYENILHADEYQKDHAHYTLFDSNWVKYAEQFKRDCHEFCFRLPTAPTPTSPGR